MKIQQNSPFSRDAVTSQSQKQMITIIKCDDDDDDDDESYNEKNESLVEDTQNEVMAVEWWKVKLVRHRDEERAIILEGRKPHVHPANHD